MILLSLIPLFALCGDGVTPEPPSISPPDSVIRRYDLKAHDLSIDPVAYPIALLPGSLELHEDESERDVDWVLGSDYAAEMIRSFCGDEFEYEGRQLWVDGEHNLTIQGPPALHEKVSRILSSLSETIHAHTELQVDIIEVPGLALEGAAVGLVNLAKAKHLLALGERANAKVESYTLSLRPGRTARVDLTRPHHLLLDYDVEVASGAIAFDPRVGTMTSGTRLEIRGAPSRKGLELAMVFTSGTATGRAEEIDLDQQGFVATDGGHTFLDGPRIVQRFAVARRSFACNTALPDGQALVLASTLELSAAQGVQYIVVRRTGGALRMVHAIDGVGDGSDAYLVNMEAISPVRLFFEGPFLAGNLSALSPDRMHWEYSSLLDTGFGWDDHDILWEALTSTCTDLEFEGDNLWLIARRDPDLTEELRESAISAPGLEEVAQNMIGDNEVVTISLVLNRRGEGSSSGVECALPAMVGQTSAVVLGVEGTTITDYDVEIAQHSAVADPIAWIAFDGLAVTLEPRRTVDGKLTLHLRGFAHLLNRSGSIDPDAPMHGALDQDLYDRLLFDEVVELTDEGNFSLWGARSTGEAEMLLLKGSVR
jgi:hypothetical protein